MKDFSKYSAIIIGAGDATGSALTKKFASKGYKVCPARRPRNIEKVLDEEGIDHKTILEMIQTKECKDKLIANTSWAVEKGAFGIPTFLIDDQIFFGKDHMDQLEDYINSTK